MAGGWEAKHDADGAKGRDTFANAPSARVAIGKKITRNVPPRAPSSGHNDAIDPEVGDNKGSTIKLGGSWVGRKYPPRTPDQVRARIPCSYAEHVSCLGHQVTSDRARSPVFYFSGLPRFQVRLQSSGDYLSWPS